MSLNASRTKLAALTRDLMSHWHDTKETWRDAKSLEFETRFLNELVSSVNRTYASIQTLDKTLTQLRNDCD